MRAVHFGPRVFPAALAVVHAVTRSCIDTQFRNAIRQTAVITRMAFSEPTDTGQDASAPNYVLESVNRSSLCIAGLGSMSNWLSKPT